jgi:hypothetical protein
VVQLITNRYMVLTTGALPDVGTPILLQWGSPITTFARADLSVSPAGWISNYFITELSA